MRPNRTARQGAKTLPLSAVVACIFAASSAFAGQATSQLSVGITIVRPASTPAPAAAPNTKGRKQTMTRDRASTIALSYH
jgi:hypothetical protein